LFELHSVSAKLAAELIEVVHSRAEGIRAKHGIAFCYLSDEFYILAGQDFPPVEFYDQMPQLSNGVGLIRRFIETWNDLLADFVAENAQSLSTPAKGTIITGEYAAPLLEGWLGQLQAYLPDLEVGVCPVKNNTFGELIKVVGLLSGKDIMDAIAQCPPGEIWLPRVMLNHNGTRFLDNITPEDIERETGRKLTILAPEAESLWEAMTSLKPAWEVED
jgi:NifB/MoaA-like Fe-S oxidoreductase